MPVCFPAEVARGPRGLTVPVGAADHGEVMGPAEAAGDLPGVAVHEGLVGVPALRAVLGHGVAMVVAEAVGTRT